MTDCALAARKTEIGIRPALGAAPAGVIKLVMWRLSLLISSGVVAGVGLSLWATTLVANLVYDIQPRDPVMIAGAGVVLGVVGGLAGGLPAWRASRIDPAELLRDC